MASLLPIEILTITKPIEHMAIAIDTDADIHYPATIIHCIYTALAVVK